MQTAENDSINLEKTCFTIFLCQDLNPNSDPLKQIAQLTT